MDVFLEAAIQDVLEESRHGVVVLRRYDDDPVCLGHGGCETGVTGTLPVVIQSVLQSADVNELRTYPVPLAELLTYESSGMVAHSPLAGGAQDNRNAEGSLLTHIWSLTRGYRCNALEDNEVPTRAGGIDGRWRPSTYRARSHTGPVTDVADGSMLAGHVGDKPVLLARRKGAWFAVEATCTHYGGPLPEGLMVEATVRCPWHHACFDLRTGMALRPPALKNLGCWQVEQRGDRVYVTAEAPAPARPAGSPRAGQGMPKSVIIVGAGAAGESAAETLRKEGYERRLVVFDPDPGAPYDRPNLSKDYLAGTAPEEWIPLHPPDFYRDLEIEIVRNRRVVGLEPTSRQIRLDDGSMQQYGALLLATGASPIRLPKEVEQGNQVHYLRTLRDSKSIIAAAGEATRVVIIGASFIGLEVAASCEPANWKSMWSGPSRVLWNASWGRRWAISSESFMRSTG